MYRLISGFNGVERVSDGATVPNDPKNTDWDAYQVWLATGNTPDPVPDPPTPTQFELDENRYKRRAAVKDQLLAYMAADNMGRVRSGVWTVPQLVSLLDDPAIVAAQGFMQTLSFELAAQNIAAATSPLMTPEIKADWVARLTANFFLVP